MSFTCLQCGRDFPLENGLGKHQCSCRLVKRRLIDALGQVKVIYSANKKRRIDQTDTDSVTAVPLAAATPQPDDLTPHLNHAGLMHVEADLDMPSPYEPEVSVNNRSDHTHADFFLKDERQQLTGLSLAESRPWRLNRLLPIRFRDVLPQPAPSLHPVPLPSSNVGPSDTTPSCHAASLPSEGFRSARNIFGLVTILFPKDCCRTTQRSWLR